MASGFVKEGFLSTGALISDRRSFWRAHIDAWSRSGLSQREYCRGHGLKESTFCDWKKRLAKEQGPGTCLVPLELGIDKGLCIGGGYSLRIELRGGYRIEVSEGFNPGTLRKVLEVLGG